ncbi:sensor histidine kinase [Gorillibacterium massiliense]|uniref:sensor histidine kinase n=1 Tax=Gorillibacterium massiliense TaxID=1280390 RepID=UPI0004AE13D5|nr:sensor histidine kinase [Gorillibacterium massiliense]
MNGIVALLRYSLLFLPGVANLYLTDYESYQMFTFALLVLILIARIRERWIPPRLAIAIAVVEAAFAGYLFHTYGGCLYFLLLSTLLSFSGSIRKPSELWLPGLALLALLNAMITPAGEVASYFIPNLSFLAGFGMLYFAETMADQFTEMNELISALSDKHYELGEARKQLVEYARKVENYAQTEERNRISQELHDNLGHKLIRLKIMMDAAVELSGKSDSRSDEIVRQVRGQLTEAMETMRTTVRKLKPEASAVRQYSLEKLIEDFGNSYGVTIHYEVSGLFYELYPSVEVLLYRNAQEAMTNAIRHGEASEISVQLRMEPGQVVFRVENNGIVPEKIGPKGLGISGMEERAALLGGKVTVECNGRFAVTTTLPRREDQLA